MPMFDYECPKCGVEDERIAKSEDVIECECGEKMIKKLTTPGMLKTNFHDKTWIKHKRTA